MLEMGAAAGWRESMERLEALLDALPENRNH